MPGFVLPVAGPYTATTYPLVERYDGDDPLPASWRLKVAFERRTNQGLSLRAVCAGRLSAVPPEELPPAWLGLTSDPGRQLPQHPRAGGAPLPAARPPSGPPHLRPRGLPLHPELGGHDG